MICAQIVKTSGGIWIVWIQLQLQPGMYCQNQRVLQFTVNLRQAHLVS